MINKNTAYLEIGTTHKKEFVTSARKAFSLLREYYSTETEHCLLITLDNNSRLIQKHAFIIEKSHAFLARNIFSYALNDNAESIIIGRTNPSGQTKPMQKDLAFACKITNVGLILDIPVYDFLIVSENEYFSLLEE